MEWATKENEEIVNSVNIEYIFVVKFWRFYKDKWKQYIEFYTEDRDVSTKKLAKAYKRKWQLCKLYKHGVKKRKNQNDEEYFDYLKPFLASIYRRWRENYLNTAIEVTLWEIETSIQEKKEKEQESQNK